MDEIKTPSELFIQLLVPILVLLAVTIQLRGKFGAITDYLVTTYHGYIGYQYLVIMVTIVLSHLSNI